MNLVITLVNHLYTGGGQRAVAIYEATAAQARVLSSMYQRLRTFLRDVPSVSGEEFVCKYLRESPGYETWDRGVCLPLGETAGVLAVAAGVDLANVLATDAPLVAEQILHPSALLLPKRDRPRAPRPFMKLAASYPAFVQRCVKAGLQKLLPLRKIYKVKGRPLLSGCFAVPKDDTEARGISALCPLNSFVDATKIPDVKFGMPSRLRAAGGPWLQRLHVSKKDARHFFHTLALGRKWHKFLAHAPVVGRSGKRLYPVSCAVPMGFRPAAGWAQCLAELAVKRAELPVQHRLVEGARAPADFPIWGSILDDVWVVDGASKSDERVGIPWLGKVETEWRKLGVQTNVKKDMLDSVIGEVQGCYIDGWRCTAGVSKEKKMLLLEGGGGLLGMKRIPLKTMERYVGKAGFAAMFKSGVRSIFFHIYQWMEELRKNFLKSGVLSPGVRDELMSFLACIPFLEFSMKAPWATRLECSDAAPGGHGRAWTAMPESTVRAAAGAAETKGFHTYVQMPEQEARDAAVANGLLQFNLEPEAFHWHKVGRPGGERHINLEEASALSWSIHERLRRPGEIGHRIVHAVDSSVVLGAVRKGRSSSFGLNAVCRQIFASCLAGNLELFLLWIGTEENPADEPSSWYGQRACAAPPPGIVGAETKAVRACPLPDHFCTDKLYYVGALLATFEAPPRPLRMRASMVVHLCSGPRREGDLVDAIAKEAELHNVNLWVLAVDPVIFRALDLLSDSFFHWLRGLVKSRVVVAIVGSPPCSTFSRVRHAPGGPRPLRAREHPLDPLPDLTEKENASASWNSSGLSSLLALSRRGLEWRMWAHRAS